MCFPHGQKEHDPKHGQKRRDVRQGSEITFFVLIQIAKTADGHKEYESEENAGAESLILLIMLTFCRNIIIENRVFYHAVAKKGI